MSWDDEDWDDDALEEKLKDQEKKAQKAEQGEDEEDEDEYPALGAAPKAKSKPQSKPKSKPKAKAKVEYQEPLADPAAEKARLRALEEQRDLDLANDLLGGLDEPVKVKESDAKADQKKAEAKKSEKVQVIVEDAFDDLELKTQKDLDDFLATCTDKLNKGKAKEAAIRFLTGIIKGLESHLDAASLQSMEKQMADFVKVKKTEKTSAQENKRKGNEKLSKTTKFNQYDEMSTVYGGGGDDDYWDEEDWDGEDY
mmetsp:Transcript_27011/g.62816  ORF Transcript_27011/g.62816 Transcript_27011/m.62816 type:complete len:254 (-) Transcript_27011:158-919(-)|eukprot:CAMPEP_0178375348 /NCGR_PEP_ID=MMETSP0689_2-20121128/2840_1 /TAXON_ID=160604 /ORGANISM="Amphidinium massartii, Strain CS-259" /LENGTH=253 /DNA_ID=CAMNT_0019995335 /DNA_START=107 /DNA_END=868 /DNA_ORIENTATION=-